MMSKHYNEDKIKEIKKETKKIPANKPTTATPETEDGEVVVACVVVDLIQAEHRRLSEVVEKVVEEAEEEADTLAMEVEDVVVHVVVVDIIEKHKIVEIEMLAIPEMETLNHIGKEILKQ